LVIVKELRRSSRISRVGRRAAMKRRSLVIVKEFRRSSRVRVRNAVGRAGVAVKEGVGYW
jgi:hypothetical protein